MQRIEITIDGKKTQIEEGLSLEDILPEGQYKELDVVMGALVNNVVQELGYIPEAGDDITLLTMSTREGNRIYLRGLLHMLGRACNRVLGFNTVRVEHSINNALYCTVHDSDEPLSPFDVERIERYMNKYSDDNEAFIKTLVKRDDVIAMFAKRKDKAELLSYSEKDYIPVYTCGSLSDYFYGAMPPSTGYVSRFKLAYDNTGFVVMYPRKRHLGEDLIYSRHPKITYIFNQSERWADILNCQNIADLNRMVKDGDLERCVLVNEALHEKVIASFADNIKDSGKRVVLISGPSSSGKTTFTQRLDVQLRVLGFSPIKISMDDYFVDRDTLPIGKDGTPDLEHINVLNITLFNEQTKELLNGNTIQLPKFDFFKGKAILNSGRFISLDSNSILMFEGIHALNPVISEGIPDDDKFKIYISAQTQLNMDNLNRVSTTDLRLLRRIVRDHHYRNTTAEQSLAMWHKVRAGEDKWIFPFEENSDVMFNSTLFYELLFIKQNVYDLLKEVKPESSVYPEALRLIDLLDYCVDPGDSSVIPRTSILREFIGGGCFEH